MTITLNNVTKELKGNLVADQIDLTLESGKVYGLCGRNGSGKTMLMRLVAGLILPTRGTIKFDGKQLGKDLDFPESIGLLIENPSFLGSRTGFDNLRMLASIRGKISDADIRRVLCRVGLDPADKRKYRKYSLGMKQRLGIAAAIMESPALIILDEPTNALDADGVELTKQIIAAERERGAIVLMTCHDQDVLEAVCDVICPIENGRIRSTVTKNRSLPAEREELAG